MRQHPAMHTQYSLVIPYMAAAVAAVYDCGSRRRQFLSTGVSPCGRPLFNNIEKRRTKAALF